MLISRYVLETRRKTPNRPCRPIPSTVQNLLPPVVSALSACQHRRQTITVFLLGKLLKTLLQFLNFDFVTPRKVQRRGGNSNAVDDKHHSCVHDIDLLISVGPRIMRQLLSAQHAVGIHLKANLLVNEDRKAFNCFARSIWPAKTFSTPSDG